MVRITARCWCSGFTDFFAHKSLFTAGFLLAAAAEIALTMARQQKSPACTACEAGTNNATPLKRGVHADGQNFECNAKTWLLRERSGARTREFP